MNSLQGFIRKLEDARDTIWRHRLMVSSIFVLLTILTVVVVSRIPHQYVATANLLVTNGNTRDDPTLQSPDLPSIATSSVILSRTQQALKFNDSVVAMKRRLTVKAPAYKSSILSLQYTDVDPDRAIDAVNGIADQMTKYVSQVSTSRFDDDLRALDRELQKQVGLIRSIDASIRAHGDLTLSAPDERGAEAITARLSTMENERALDEAVVSGDRARLLALEQDARARKAAQRHEILQNDKAFSDLQSVVATNAASLEEAKAIYTPAFPGLGSLQTKVDRLQSALARERKRSLASADAFSSSAMTFDTERRDAAIAVKTDSAKLSALDTLLQTERQRLATLPSVELLRLQRTAAQADYLAISARHATSLANRADALSLGSVVIVDRAIKAETVTGFTGNKVLASLVLLALILGISSAFVADGLNPSLRRASQIENLYGGPVLGSLGNAS